MICPRQRLYLNLLVIVVLTIAAASAAAEPAKVVSVTQGGVGNVEISSGADGVSAQIGRWDTPYPNSDTGERAPGLEPDGASTLRIDIDVHDGGIVSFAYRFLTYDAGIYDWLDITMVTPSGTEQIVTNYGKPGRDYGNYWESAFIVITKSLDAWHNQRVSFFFSVQQDGWGDQSAARIANFAVRSCRTLPLSVITDEEALLFENGNTVNTAKLTTAMQMALSCLRQTVTAANGSLTVTSAYRPSTYQVHIREVWDRWNDLRLSRDQECSVLRAQVEAEFKKHSLKLSQRPATTSLHTAGQAFDANWTPSSLSIDSLAASCNLKRPLIATDPVHFIQR